jgi:hypothetical protein
MSEASKRRLERKSKDEFSTKVENENKEVLEIRIEDFEL